MILSFQKLETFASAAFVTTSLVLVAAPWKPSERVGTAALGSRIQMEWASLLLESATGAWWTEGYAGSQLCEAIYVKI